MSLKNLLTDLQSYYKEYTFSQKYPANSEYATKPEAIAEGTFDQKSIPYGYDRPGGGWSGQPFITIPFKDSFGLPLEDIGNVGLNNDLFIRGGASVAKHIKNDEIRIGKFLKSTQGVLFTAQQNLLIKTSPVNLPGDIYPVEIYNPLNTLVQIAGNAFGDHTNKLGLNPFLYDLPHGQGQNSYLIKTKDKYNEDNTNRLTLLYQSKILKVSSSPNIKVSKAFGIQFNDDNFIINTALVNINRESKTFKDIVIVNKEQSNSSKFSTIISSELAQTNPKQYNSTNINGSDGVLDFRDSVPSSTTFKSFLAKSDYLTNNRQSTFGMSDPGLRSKDVSDISALSSGTPSDSINLSSIYKSNTVSSSLSDSDLIPFYFQVVNNDDPSQYEFIHFRAYLENFSDNFAGNWQSFKYSGRGENFYIYDSFQRTISFGFTIAIESRAEQSPQYQKINYLASLTAPDYAQNSGFMRGCFVKMTVGDYLQQVPGFLTSVNYTVANNIPWDIARGVDGKLLTNTKILPTVISTNVNFTPVHSFVPKKGANFISTNIAV
jgi:hypothetical protein